MIQPAPYHMTAWAGAEFLIDFQCCDANGPINLTGWVPVSHARKSDDNATGPGIDFAPVITDAAVGKIRYLHDKDATKDWVPGNYDWDLLFDKPSGERVGPYAKGRFLVKPLATRPSP